jgi:hydrogenase maturation protease
MDVTVNKQITVLGIGCTLYADQGFGVSVIRALNKRYELPEHVLTVDGGLIGVGLTGIIARADHLIAVDAFCNGGSPGDIYRLEKNRILARLAGKHRVQHVEFLEALAHCQALDNPPRAVLLGIEPSDTTSLVCELTPELKPKIDEMIGCILDELDRLGATCRKK